MVATRLTTDVLQAMVTRVAYQGPATNIYLWAGVAQGNAVKYQVQAPVPIAVPLAPSPVILTPNLLLNMGPLAGNLVPVPGAGDGVFIVLMGPDPASTRLFTFNAPRAYTIVAPSGGGGGDIEALNLVQNIHYAPDGSVLGDFIWTRNWQGRQVDYEFLDLTTDGGASILGLDTFRDITVQVDSAGRVQALNIPLAPNTDHWWRVNTHDQVANQWFPTAFVPFHTPPVQGGGGVPTVTDVQVTFS